LLLFSHKQQSSQGAAESVIQLIAGTARCMPAIIVKVMWLRSCSQTTSWHILTRPC